MSNQQNPFNNPAKHNRETEAQRMGSRASARAEVAIAADNAFENMKRNFNASPDMPTGFAMPPPPPVNEPTVVDHRKMPVVPDVGPQPQNIEAMKNALGLISNSLAQEGQPAPEQTVPAPEVQRATVRRPPVVKKTTEVVSPILRQLRLDLGLDTQKTIDLTIGDHIWSFTPLSPEMTTLSLRIADLGGAVEIERDVLREYAGVCCSVVAIDGEPLWKVFSLEPEEGDDVSNIKFPKGRIRQRAAMSLLQELMTNGKLGVMQALREAYNAEVDPMGNVKGYKEYSGVKHFRFTCKVEGCTHTMVRAKKYDGSNNELAYFCEVHGEPMEASVLDSLKAGLSPLA